jgi:hypothetical protein
MSKPATATLWQCNKHGRASLKSRFSSGRAASSSRTSRAAARPRASCSCRLPASAPLELLPLASLLASSPFLRRLALPRLALPFGALSLSLLRLRLPVSPSASLLPARRLCFLAFLRSLPRSRRNWRASSSGDAPANAATPASAWSSVPCAPMLARPTPWWGQQSPKVDGPGGLLRLLPQRT